MNSTSIYRYINNKLHFFVTNILWSFKYGFIPALLLSPLSAVYFLAYLFKQALARPKSAKAKVICVGNATVGGEGKTPIVAYIAKELLKRKKKVAIISRGYKGSLSSKNRAIRVTSKHSAQQVGDEALLHFKIAPTYICPNRFTAAQKAVKDGAEIIIMDDGYQNQTLKIDTYILVIDCKKQKTQNGFLLPLGNKREPLFLTLQRADFIISMNGKYNMKALEAKMRVENPQDFSKKKVILLTAIGNPEKVYKTLQELNANIIDKFYFPDHYFFFEEEIEKIFLAAEKHNAIVATTSKDATKIPQRFHNENLKTIEISVALYENNLEKSFFRLLKNEY